MNLGLIGLLRLLQTASPMPADTSNPDSIGFLRDSVVIPYIMEEGREYMHPVDLPFLYNNPPHASQTIHLPSVCKMYVLKYDEGKFASAALCRDIRYDMEAFLLTVGNFRNPENLMGRIMVDWKTDNIIDFCEETGLSDGRIIEISIPKDQCQSHYLPMLKALKEEYERRNTPPPVLISDLD